MNDHGVTWTGHKEIDHVQARFNPSQNDLTNEFLLKFLKIDITKFGEQELARSLFSPFAQTWANNKMTKLGPNCFHNVVASLSLGWEAPRFMDEVEYLCHLAYAFEEISEPSQLGDVIHFYWVSATAPPQTPHSLSHAVVFVGENQDGKKIIYQKNGYNIGSYRFTTLDLIKEQTIGNDNPLSSMRYFRIKAPTLDPKFNSMSPCKAVYEKKKAEIMKMYPNGNFLY